MRRSITAAALLAVAAAPARAQQPALDVEAAQAILAVQGLDGWLLAQSSTPNPIAAELVAPAGQTAHAWFYFVPASGEPVALVHQGDAAAFASAKGRKVEYT